MFSCTQNTPRFQNGVALSSLIHRLAQLGFVGINGLLSLSTTVQTRHKSHLSLCFPSTLAGAEGRG